MKKVHLILLFFVIFFIALVNAKASTNILSVNYNVEEQKANVTWNKETGSTNYSLYINDDLYTTTTKNKETLNLKENSVYKIELQNNESKENTDIQIIYTGEIDHLSTNTKDDSSINIKYNRVYNASGYYIYRSANDDKHYTLLATINNPDITYYSDTTAINDVVYYYKVVPYIIQSRQTISGYTAAKVVNVKFTKNKITGLKVSQINKNTNRICWKKKSGATGYKIYYSKTEYGKYKKVGKTTKNCIYKYNLKLGKTYYYKVRAYKKVGKKKKYSAYSNTISKTIKLLKPSVKIKIYGNSGITITYNKIPYVKKYKIYRATSEKGNYRLIKTTSKSSYTNKSLKKNKLYCYKVEAYTKKSGKYYSRKSKAICETTTERNAKYKLNLKSVYGDTEAYHPGVIAFDSPWNGYKYWMVFTPYPKSNAAKENPHIVASNNKINWVTPKGTINPLDTPTDPETGPVVYNSDGELVYNSNLNRIECFWRRWERTEVVLYMKSTTNGITWSERQEIYRTQKFGTDFNKLLSPSIIYDNGSYKMWYANNNGPYKILYEEFDSIPFIKLKERKTIYLNTSDKIYPWHLDIIKNNNKYEMIFVATPTIGKIHHMNLYYMNSIDNVIWSKPIKILSPSKDINAWDNRGIYRSSMFYENGKYYLYYSASNKKDIKGTSVVYGKYLTDLYPYFN